MWRWKQTGMCLLSVLIEELEIHASASALYILKLMCTAWTIIAVCTKKRYWRSWARRAHHRNTASWCFARLICEDLRYRASQGWERVLCCNAHPSLQHVLAESARNVVNRIHCDFLSTKLLNFCAIGVLWSDYVSVMNLMCLIWTNLDRIFLTCNLPRQLNPPSLGD